MSIIFLCLPVELLIYKKDWIYFIEGETASLDTDKKEWDLD